MTNTTKQHIALGEYLSDYPQSKSYDEIIQALKSAEISFPEDIDACEFFEDWYPPALAERIEGLLTTLEKDL